MRKHKEPEKPVSKPKARKKGRLTVASIVRIVLQILFFIWMPALYISAFSGLEELFTSLVTGTFSLSSIWPDLLAFAAVIPMTILVGRFFCGWMCAFGSLTDWVYRIFSRWTKSKIRLSRKADSILKGLKYVVLAALLVLGWLAGSLSLSIMSPWDAFGMLFTVGAVPALLYVLQSLLPGFILLVVILAASVFVERFFCRYLCPMGAFFAITSGARLVYIDKPRDSCGKCQICTKNCAMGIPLNQMDKVKSGECIGCMKCVDACPRKNIKVHAGKTPINMTAIAVTVAALMTGLFVFATALTAAANNSLVSSASTSAATTAATTTAAVSAAAQTSLKSVAEEDDDNEGNTAATVSASAAAPAATTSPAAPAATTAVAPPAATTSAAPAATTAAATASGQYIDGTYTGTGTGFRGGSTTIEVTISGGQISNIAVVSYQDDAPYFNKAFPTISSNAVSTQSAAVDVVSHATYSSKGIIGAIADALAQAK